MLRLQKYIRQTRTNIIVTVHSDHLETKWKFPSGTRTGVSSKFSGSEILRRVNELKEFGYVVL